MSDGPSNTEDPQGPLPEANWLWRRVLTYFLCIAFLLVMAGCGFAMFRIVNTITGKLDSMNAAAVVQITLAALATVEQMFRLMFWALLTIVTYYMVAPSAEQITKMMQTAGLLKAGVQIASRTLDTPETRETATTVALPPQPAVPPTLGDGAADNRPTTREISPLGSDSDAGGSLTYPGPEIASTGVSDEEVDFAPRSNR